ncbi:hypothetical protein niasHT_026933 [Heterodera trifolii]|uniref:KCTD8/12/16 H1 domain-containing protein n=1 Tax=Heterodera trifolii TaxID=157864 RepID=A0ABD2KRS4_9BILA
MQNSVAPSNGNRSSRIVRLRLSTGHRIEVFAHVLCREPNSLLAELAGRQPIIECAHRDGRLVRLLVNCLRHCLSEDGRPVKKFVPPEQFDDWRQLITEAQYWRLPNVEQLVRDASSGVASTITIGYHGTLALGRGTFSNDVNFRKIDRILVSGKARACREVFGRFLNETRDWDIDNARYTSRFYLIHTFLEKAFDALAAHRYTLVSSSSTTPRCAKSSGRRVHTKANTNNNNNNSSYHDERKFSHFSQFVFVRTS